jgi:hypothetical protein
LDNRLARPSKGGAALSALINTGLQSVAVNSQFLDENQVWNPIYERACAGLLIEAR